MCGKYLTSQVWHTWGPIPRNEMRAELFTCQDCDAVWAKAEEQRLKQHSCRHSQDERHHRMAITSGGRGSCLLALTVLAFWRGAVTSNIAAIVRR